MDLLSKVRHLKEIGVEVRFEKEHAEPGGHTERDAGSCGSF